MINIKPFLLFATLFLAGNAWGITLDQGKAQGLVGETLTGYLAVVKPTQEAETLVHTINAARKNMYQDVAASNNISTDDVAKIAGKKLVTRAKPGEYVRGINGLWLQKE